MQANYKFHKKNTIFTESQKDYHYNPVQRYLQAQRILTMTVTLHLHNISLLIKRSQHIFQ